MTSVVSARQISRTYKGDGTQFWA
ncbi:MAG: hypothetical protein JWN15_3600, partial [Firmicutes bacterium]|nr:hypothetical protein [Bacillota bacterium]